MLKDWQGFLSGFARIDPSGASRETPDGQIRVLKGANAERGTIHGPVAMSLPKTCSMNFQVDGIAILTKQDLEKG